MTPPFSAPTLRPATLQPPLVVAIQRSTMVIMFISVDAPRALQLRPLSKHLRVARLFCHAVNPIIDKSFTVDDKLDQTPQFLDEHFRKYEHLARLFNNIFWYLKEF